MKMLTAVVVVSLVILTGCFFGPDAVVSVNTDEASYTLGDTLAVTVTNLSNETLEYGCGFDLERWREDTGQWVLSTPLFRGCLTILRRVGGGESFSAKYVFPESTQSHPRYRVTFDGFDPDKVPQDETVSNEFAYTR